MGSDAAWQRAGKPYRFVDCGSVAVAKGTGQESSVFVLAFESLLPALLFVVEAFAAVLLLALVLSPVLLLAVVALPLLRSVPTVKESGASELLSPAAVKGAVDIYMAVGLVLMQK